MHDSIFSASQGGKSAFVSVEDVAQAAFEALVAEKTASLRDPIVVGPQVYSFSEVRSIFVKLLEENKLNLLSVARQQKF